MRSCISLFLLVGQVVRDPVLVGLHRLLSWPPSGWANLAMLVRELEGLDKSEGFIDIAANWEIIDSDLADLALGVNDEEATESNSLILLEENIYIDVMPNDSDILMF